MPIDKYSINKHIKALLKGFILLQAMLLCSCHVLHDDLSECDLFLKFRYDYNMSYEDWFKKDHVEEISSSLALKDYKLKNPFQISGYTAVVWAEKTGEDYILPQMSGSDEADKLTLNYKPKNDVSSHHIASLSINGWDY